MKLKYIRLRKHGFVVFTETMKHTDMASKFPSDEVTSAGFVEYANGKAECYGESTSLNMKPAENDSSLLTYMSGL